MKVIQQRMPQRATRCPTESSGGASESSTDWWGEGNTRCPGGEGPTEREAGGWGRLGGIAVVEGIDAGGEKEVAEPMAGMTYLRNQVYVGRRSIVPVRSRAGLPPVAAAVVLSTVFVVGAAGK